MPLRPGDLGPIISRQPPQGQGANTLMRGMEGLSQGFRDQEAKRRAGVQEEMAARQQTEVERKHVADEEFRSIQETVRIEELERKKRREGLEKFITLQNGRKYGEAAAVAKEYGLDATKPEQLMQDYQRSHDESQAAEDEMAKAWLKKSDQELGYLVEDVTGPPGEGEQFDPEKHKQSEKALSDDLDSWIDIQARGMTLQPPEQQAPPPQPGGQMAPMGMAPQQPRAQQAPAPQQQQAPQTQPQPMPQMMSPMGMQPQMQQQPQGPPPSPSAVMLNGALIDVEARREALIMETTDSGVALIQEMSQGVREGDRQAYEAAAKGWPWAARMTEGNTEKAWKLMMQDSFLEIMRRTQKEEGQEAAIRAARASTGRRDTSEEHKWWKEGRKMVEDVVADSGGIKQVQALQSLGKIPDLLRSDSVTAHEAARTIMARERGEKGAMSEGDIKRSTGTFGAFDTVSNWMERLAVGGLTVKQREAMAKEVEIMITSTQKQVRNSYEHAKQAATTQAGRTQHHGDGGVSYITDTFRVESDPYLQFLTADKRRPTSAEEGREAEGRRRRSLPVDDDKSKAERRKRLGY